MGASTAYHLSRRGLTNVALVERETMLAMGSTGRNAGGVRHQFSSASNVRLSIESIRLIERFHEAVGYEIDFHQDGYLFLLSAEESLAAFRRSVEMQRRLGVAVDLLSPEEAARLSPGLKVDGVIAATFCARDGIADPNGVTMGFAKAAQAAGVEINRSTEVTAILTEGGRVKEVRTDKGSISTPNVVNAAGPYARQIGEMVGLDIPVYPYRRHIFITEPVAAAGLAVPASHIMVIDYESTFYFHREGAGILFGMGDPAERAGYDLTVRWDFLEEVSRMAVRRLPALAALGVAHAWAGLYEVTPDAMPIIGRARELEGFHLINGFSGHGFQHSPAAGRILADVIIDGSPGDIDIAPFAFERFAVGRGEIEAAMI
jgi:sarcosine oxidase subunit beta